MARRLVGPLVVGALGTATLLALGFWQLQRLEWKLGQLTKIDARVAAEPVSLPEMGDSTAHAFLSVEAVGRISSEALRVVATDAGRPAFRIISSFETDSRTVLLDRGVIASEAPVPDPPGGLVTVVGNLAWPDEKDAFTPAPEIDESLWYARDVPAMASALGTEPLLIVAREVPGDKVSPRPIGTSGIPNNHLEYAVTWFALGATWAGMTLALVWRMRRRIG